MLKEADLSSLYPYDYSLIHNGGISHLMLFYPYTPLAVSKNFVFIDNYYPAFQSLRKYKLKIKDFLLSKGYEIWAEQGVFKPIALQSGKVCSLRNNLMYHRTYGTYFVMEILSLKGEFGNPPQPPMTSLCTSCDLCVNACENGCLAKGFEKEKCLRYLQEREEDFSRIGGTLKNFLWGCNSCQRACPLNKQKAVEGTAEYLDPAMMFRLALQGKKALQEVYGDVLGDNYIRPRKLLALSIVALANCNRFELSEQVIALKSHPDERVRNAVGYFLSRGVKEVEREHKIILTAKQYESIVDSEKVDKEIFQRNYYFISSNLSDKLVLRIREKDGSFTLTVKEHISTEHDVNTVNEFNYMLSADLADSYIKNGFDLSCHHKTDGSAICRCIGFMDTLRKVINRDGITLELDFNRYHDREDFELECEISTAESDEKFYSFLRLYGITPTVPKAKYFRFLDSL